MSLSTCSQHQVSRSSVYSEAGLMKCCTSLSMSWAVASMYGFSTIISSCWGKSKDTWPSFLLIPNREAQRECRELSCPGVLTEALIQLQWVQVDREDSGPACDDGGANMVNDHLHTGCYWVVKPGEAFFSDAIPVPGMDDTHTNC